MTDTNDWMSQFFAERAVRAEAAKGMFERNKAILIPILAGAGIVRVEIEFDGIADSGNVDTPVCFLADNACVDCPAVTVEIEDFSGLEGRLQTETKPLSEALVTIVYNALDVHHSGWEINEGAFGTFTIDVEDGTMMLGCNLRSSDYHEHELGEEG